MESEYKEHLFLPPIGCGRRSENEQKIFGDGGYRSPYLSHAKRALYHLSYVPLVGCFVFRAGYICWLETGRAVNFGRYVPVSGFALVCSPR